MTWLSPAYPVGGYSYSHGLEWTVETGEVTRRRDARRLDRGRAGARRRADDAIVLAKAWRALAAGDDAALEHRRAGRGAGAVAGAAPRDHGPGRGLPAASGRLAKPEGGARRRPARALSGRRRRVRPPRTACRWPRRRTAFAHAFAANLVSAGVRLSRWARPTACACSRAGAADPARRRRRRGRRSTTSAAPPRRRHRLHAARDPVTRLVQRARLHMTTQRTPAGRHRRPRRLRQDDAGGDAVQGHARPLRHRGITNDIYTQEDALILSPPARCPRTASWASRPAAARTPPSARTRR